MRPEAELPGSWWVLGAKGGNEVEAALLCGDNVNSCLSGQEEGMDEEWKGALAGGLEWPRAGRNSFRKEMAYAPFPVLLPLIILFPSPRP